MADLRKKFPSASNISINIMLGSIIVEIKLTFDRLSNAQAAKEAIKGAVNSKNFSFITGAEVEAATTPLLDVVDALKLSEEEGNAMVPLMVTIVVLIAVAMVGIVICGVIYALWRRRTRRTNDVNATWNSSMSPQQDIPPSIELTMERGSPAHSLMATTLRPDNINLGVPITPSRTLSAEEEHIGVDMMTPSGTPSTLRRDGHAQTMESAVQVTTAGRISLARSGPTSRLGKYHAFARAMSPNERPSFSGWNSRFSSDATRPVHEQYSNQQNAQPPANRLEAVNLEHGSFRSSAFSASDGGSVGPHSSQSRPEPWSSKARIEAEEDTEVVRNSLSSHNKESNNQSSGSAGASSSTAPVTPKFNVDGTPSGPSTADGTLRI